MKEDRSILDFIDGDFTFVNPELAKHWLANALTPFVGDANSRTPEFKAFLVDIKKIE